MDCFDLIYKLPLLSGKLDLKLVTSLIYGAFAILTLLHRKENRHNPVSNVILLLFSLPISVTQDSLFTVVIFLPQL